MSSGVLCTWILVFIGLLVNPGESEIRITKELKDFTGFKNVFHSLQYRVAGKGTLKYQWYHNGSTITSKSGILGWDRDGLFIRDAHLEHQGIYQLFISSFMGRIFGREIKVEYTVVGEFQSKQDKIILDVVIGQSFQIPCPPHSFTRNAVYKWGNTGQHDGTSFFEPSDDVIVLHDGTLFFSQVTQEDVKRVKQKNGIKCLLDGNYEKITRIESSRAYDLNVVETNKTSFGPVMVKFQNREVVEGDYILLRCIAAGYPTPTYVWEKTDENGVTTKVFDQVNGIQLSYKNKFLTIETARKENAGIYKCHATITENGTQRTATEQSKLTVREKPKWVAGRFIKSATPEILSQHTWTCMAKGDPEPVYHWYANATIMKNQSGRHTIEGGILTFHRVTEEDNGMYQCVAKNRFGFEYQTVSMIVKVQRPTITTLDSRTTLIASTRGVISCQSEAIPHAVHQWFNNDVKLEIDTTERYELENNQGLVIHNVTKADTGNYTCTAKNMFGEATGHTIVSVGEIEFKTRPKDNLNVEKADTFSLSCEAGSEPPLVISYKWRFQGEDVQIDDTHYVYSESNNKLHKLLVLSSELSDSGIYQCVAYVEQPSNNEQSIYVEKIAPATIIVHGVSDPPENLMLKSNCSNSQVNLSWEIRYRSPYVPLTRLLIQWRSSNDTDTWYNASDLVQPSSETHVMRGLNPWSDISFRAIAINKYGMSQHSKPTEGNKCKTPASKPTKCPENVEGMASKPRIIEVTWKKVPAIYENGPGFNYIVSYRMPNSTWRRETVDRESEPKFTIHNAGHYQLWELTVQSNNSEGPVPKCPVTTARSVKEAPSLAPQSFMYKRIGPRYVELAWESSGASGDTVLGYKISYWQNKISPNSKRRHSRQSPRCGDKTKPCEVLVEGGGQKEHRLGGLLPYKRYTMLLRAYNKGGDGPNSEPLVFDTKQHTPGPPHHIRLTPFGKYIRMQWRSPREPNGVITGYVAKVKGGEDVELGASKAEFLFSDLEPEHEYEVFIQAKTLAGPGETAVKMVNTTAIRVPATSKAPGVQGVNEDSVNVTFNPSYTKGGFPERFYVMYKEEGQEDKYLKKSNETWLTGDDGKSHIVISGLESRKKYVFSTIVVNGERKSEKSEFTPGRPITNGGERTSDSDTPFYLRYWFYIVISLLILLLLLLLLLLFLRRKPRETYKVSEREKKHGQKEPLFEVGEEHPLTTIESDDEGPQPKGKTYDAIEPTKQKSASAMLANNSPERDSLDDYDGEDDDFSEHGSFIGQYGPGKKTSASQSSLPAFV